MELPDRLEREARMAARLNGEFEWLRGRIEKCYGVDWDAFERRVAEIIEEEATAVYVAMWLLMWDDWSGRLDLGPIPGGEGSIAIEAKEYGSNRAKAVANQFRVNVRVGLRAAAIDNRNILDSLPTPERAEVIATTEVTEARSQGQRSAAATIERRSGVQLLMYWLTVQDDKVCPTCRPLHGTTQEEWRQVFSARNGPPAHPNCRCQLRPELDYGVDVGPPVASGRN